MARYFVLAHDEKCKYIHISGLQTCTCTKAALQILIIGIFKRSLEDIFLKIFSLLFIPNQRMSFVPDVCFMDQ